MIKSLSILGTRGIPAAHGGFETFAEHLATYLSDHGWKVTVYCQTDNKGSIYEDKWKGITRVHIPIHNKKALGTVFFDLKSVLHASKRSSLIILTLGYNTALFNLLFRFSRINNLINMDGIEWRREKWNFLERAWLYLNEKFACLIGDHLIADHPEIKTHLSRKVSENKISVIPYGANSVTQSDWQLIRDLGIEKKKYCLVIARPEPENSILEIVIAFSRKQRKQKLVVLGNYKPNENQYHKMVIDAASDDVLFFGAIYDKRIVEALRFFASLYVHGHTVGGTNPSLVEALGACSPILAHDNIFNRWVINDAGAYFVNEEDCAIQFETLLEDNVTLKNMSEASCARFEQMFTWDKILGEYESLLNDWL